MRINKKALQSSPWQFVRFSLLLLICLCFPIIAIAKSSTYKAIEVGDQKAIDRIFKAGDLTITGQDYRKIIDSLESGSFSAESLSCVVYVFELLEIETLEFSAKIYAQIDSEKDELSSEAIRLAFRLPKFGPRLLRDRFDALSVEKKLALAVAIEESSNLEPFYGVLIELAKRDSTSSKQWSSWMFDYMVPTLSADQALGILRAFILEQEYELTGIFLTKLVRKALVYEEAWESGLSQASSRDAGEDLKKILTSLFKQTGPTLNESLRANVLKAATYESLDIRGLTPCAWVCLKSDPDPVAAAQYLLTQALSKAEKSQFAAVLKGRIIDNSDHACLCLPIYYRLEPLNKANASLYTSNFDRSFGKSSTFDNQIVSTYWKNDPDFHLRAIAKLLGTKMLFSIEAVFKSVTKCYPTTIPAKFKRVLTAVANSDSWCANRVRLYLEARASNKQ